ncbi:autotransporter outer membrane beta-barrel domain-containing protein [Collimonas sp. OK412]|uniref:autotransporter family protein n=1 Tax=Collimonas sp. (strain OK412) TaxID=1801619 RepID=UPI00158773D4|nr:autotransporter outer membrane beta-barrel domain-containing protein [Collimonas sp. OK412]
MLEVSNNPGGLATGIGASGNAQVAVTNSTIFVSASGGSINRKDPFIGVAAFNSGTRVDLADTSVYVRASLNSAGGFTNAYGLNAGSGSVITMSNGVLQVDAGLTGGTAHSIGALATGSGSLISLADVLLISNGDGAQGLVVNQGGSAVVRGGYISSEGDAVTVGAGGGSATLLDTWVSSSADNAITLQVLDTGGASAVLAMDGTHIITSGVNSVGARVDGPAAELLVSNGSFGTTGEGGIGVQAVGGGSAKLLNAPVYTEGANSRALQAGAAGDSATSTLVFQGGKVQASGAGAVGALIAAGGDATFIDTSIQAIGADGAALLLQNGALAATARVSNSVLNSTDGAAIEVVADPAVRAAAVPVQVSLLNGTQVSSGTGVLLNAGADTQTSLAMNGGVHAVGDIVANGNAIVDVSLENRSLWNGTTSTVRNLSLDAGSQWQMAGSSTVQNLSHAGLVSFADPAGGNYHTLTVQGDIAGQNGVVALNTVLNEGGALANQHTNRLLVEGNATGTTLIEVKPTGTGALTDLRKSGVVDADEGISIVQVGGDSHAGAFALKGGYVAAGPWQYTLHAFGPGETDPSQSLLPGGGLNWDYRLGNTFVCEGGCEPGEPGDPGEIDKPEGPGEPEVPNPGRIAVVPQIPSYLVAPTALFNYGSRTLDTLHQRLGELRNIAGKSDDQLGGEVFARVLGGQLKYRSDLSFNDYGYDFEQQMNTLQAGGSLVKWHTGDSTMRAGWAIDLGTTRVTPQAADGESHANYTAYGVSGWLTWQQASGFYVDAVLGAQRFSGDVSTTLRGSNVAKIHADMWTASLEVGYPFAVGKGWSVEPQAQVTRQWLNFKNFNDVDGLTTHIASAAQTTGRVGVRVAKTDEPKFAPYLRADLVRSIGGRPQVTVASEAWNVSETFSGGRLGASYRVGAGASSQFANNVSLYGEATYQHGMGSAGLRGWAANAGVRWNF